MDPITLAIITGAATGVATSATDTLIMMLKEKYGKESNVAKAADLAKENPDSEAYQAVLEKEVQAVNADQNPDLVGFAEVLLEKLKEQPGGSAKITQDVDIKGNRNIVSGQGSITVNE